MKTSDQAALVTGAGSGLGAATARQLARMGARVALLDIDADRALATAKAITESGGRAIGIGCDVTSEESAQAAIEAAQAAHGPARILLNVAGIGNAKRIVGKDGSPAPLADFERVVRVNLIGSYNMARLFAALAVPLEPLADGERGVIVNTASVAAYDGQVGQEAYAASKGGIASMTLPLARDLAQWGIRAMTIAPGLFRTPLMAQLPPAIQESLGASVPFPRRLGEPDEFAHLAVSIIENVALNGEVIRLDGALRLAPR